MQLVTDAAVAAVLRADDFTAGGLPTEATLAELASARQAVDELARHTRLIAAYTASREKFADEQNEGNPPSAMTNLCNRHHEVLREFGLDPINDPADEVARAVAVSRIRDSLLGMLAEWQSYATILVEERKPGLRVSAPVASKRLGEVIRAACQLCGGAYAKWQDLHDRNDVPGLVAFAASADGGLKFRSTLASALGRDLVRVKQHAACRTFLREAIERYPHDVWLHYDLYRVCQTMRPQANAEALRHISAASVQRPRCALFHFHVGGCYYALGSYDQAVAAQRRAIKLGSDSYFAHVALGFSLLATKDWDGAAAELRTAIPLLPSDVRAHTGLIMALTSADRHTEALEATLAAFRQRPHWAEDPRSHFRYDAACSAANCADGKGVNPPPPAEGPAYRKQALDFLTAELAAMRKLAATDRAFVYRMMQHWLVDTDLVSVREPAAVERLPPKERDAWKKLWADVRDLRDRTTLQIAPPPSAK